MCLGGGTVRYEWNLDALRGSGMIVLLEAREEVLIERVSIADRPRVTDTDDPAQDIRTMWRRYRDRYVAAADYVYRSDEKPVAQEVADLAALVTGDSRFAGVLPA